MKKNILVFAFALMSLAVFADDNMPSQKVGTPAPEFSATDTLGIEHSLIDYRGHYLVLDFWASWCGDCRREIPALKKLFAEYADKTIEDKAIDWLSVSFDHAEGAWKNCLRKEEFPWLQVSNLIRWKDNPIAEKWELHWIPTFFVIDPEGRIAGSAITADGLRDVLTGLAEK